MSMAVSLATTSLRIMLSEVLCNSGCNSPAASLDNLVESLFERDLVHHVPGHACPGAAAAGHVRPSPGVPRDAGGPWRRWLTTALQKYQGSVFMSANIVFGSLTSNSITFSNLVGGKLPPSLDRDDTELLPFLLLLDLPEEPCRGFSLIIIIIFLCFLLGWRRIIVLKAIKVERLTSKSERQLKLERLPPFFEDSETFFFFFLLEESVCWVCFLKLISHCSSPLEFSSAFSKSS